MKHHYFWIPLILVGAILLTCSAALARKVRGAVYTHPDKLFSIEVPQGWSVGHDALKITVLSKRRGSGFQDRIKVVAAPLAAGMTLDRYIENSLLTYKDAWTVEKREKVTIGGVDARKYVIEQKLPTLTTRNLKCFLVKKEHIFVITCEAEPSAFKSSLPVFEEVLATFKPFP
jgi:hypothetical protein